MDVERRCLKYLKITTVGGERLGPCGITDPILTQMYSVKGK